MENVHPRIQRERETIIKMSYLYCREQHGVDHGTLCDHCQELMDYALERLHRCPFQEQKPTCANCTVHCYKPVMRERVRVMMRYSGPRMLLHHPVLAVRHLIDGRIKPKTTRRKVKEG